MIFAGGCAGIGVIVEAVDRIEEADLEFQALLARDRALAGVERAVRELAANILSVVRGKGKPDLIAAQAEALVNTIDTHRSIAGCPPSPEEIAAVLNIATKEERVVLLNGAKLRATQRALSSALKIAAIRLGEIRSHAPGGVEGLTEDDYGERPADAER
jgi:coenzyme F420-reducing hydrogenase gamma subunit